MELDTANLAKARAYIDSYWQRLVRKNETDSGTLIGLPNPYLVPSYPEDSEFNYDELYYWDSYFMVQGMLDEPHKDLVLGILDDLIYLFQRFNIIPNGSRLYYTSRTQPPFLTSFIFDVYDAYNLDAEWLREKIFVAMQEYETVWMGTKKPNARQVYQGLSRYYDFNYLNDLAEAESGWDMTPRFERKALDYLPIDLNTLLYKYEKDFARAARILGDTDEAAAWDERAQRRKETIDKLMWSERDGLYYDYNYATKKRGTVASLASFYPLWAGMVDEKRAARLVRSLARFEKAGGLVTAVLQPLTHRFRRSIPLQWAYPNGWAPLQFLIIKGLERYGFHAESKRIALKWLQTNLNWFTAHGEFLEKYNVVHPAEEPAKGLYPPQTGFGWSNAVFERLCRDYVDGGGRSGE
ncbi:MAG: trehalase family glycosidase [Minisyncoccia bacterium]